MGWRKVDHDGKVMWENPNGERLHEWQIDKLESSQKTKSHDDPDPGAVGIAIIFVVALIFVIIKLCS